MIVQSAIDITGCGCILYKYSTWEGRSKSSRVALVLDLEIDMCEIVFIYAKAKYPTYRYIKG